MSDDRDKLEYYRMLLELIPCLEKIRTDALKDVIKVLREKGWTIPADELMLYFDIKEKSDDG